MNERIYKLSHLVLTLYLKKQVRNLGVELIADNHKEMSPLKLKIFEWGPYTARILTYLYWKRLENPKHIRIININPPVQFGRTGRGPTLEFPDGRRITSTPEIIEYFEDICDNPKEQWQRELASAAGPSMRGRNSAEIEEKRAILRSIDTTTTDYMCSAAYKCSRAGPLRSDSINVALDQSEKSLSGLQDHYWKMYKAIDKDHGPRICVADIALLSLIEYIEAVNHRNIVSRWPILNSLYETFKVDNVDSRVLLSIARMDEGC